VRLFTLRDLLYVLPKTCHSPPKSFAVLFLASIDVINRNMLESFPLIERLLCSGWSQKSGVASDRNYPINISSSCYASRHQMTHIHMYEYYRNRSLFPFICCSIPVLVLDRLCLVHATLYTTTVQPLMVGRQSVLEALFSFVRGSANMHD